MAYPPPSSDAHIDSVPPAAPPVSPVPPAVPSADVAIAALIVGIAAALMGLLPVLSLPLGLAGIVLAIIAIRMRVRRGFGIAGLVLSIVAVITGILVSIFSLFVLPGVLANVDFDALEELQDDSSLVESGGLVDDYDVDGQVVVTPCYSFDGPAGFLQSEQAANVGDCWTTLNLWGEFSEDGTFTNTGVGAVWGSVSVEPVSTATSDLRASPDDLDGIVDSLAEDYIPQLGQLISLTEAATLDGQPANITRVQSDAEQTQTKALIVAFAPESYATSSGDVQLMLISVVTPFDNGDALIDSIVESWRWR
ncbi:DUF4190 domain-containing protein [Rhodoglobus sp. NPDC076762]